MSAKEEHFLYRVYVSFSVYVFLVMNLSVGLLMGLYVSNINNNPSAR